ncbi:uncharacterized protein BJ171DRAFT_487272 [Polychytrium aggregatum]|uniref:uncharacterized protein n=1 Tax=Polychytrium aggregatum TaxID=110093 RepID=UPI0022FDC8C9|nr:uncharacterized protein BJ171DRAFT_487272 [Polychytrium aggregatum]KAI9208786.1 hypothetical protein BJ171DRAFT_487272 [Polychytrium aggregatum]
MTHGYSILADFIERNLKPDQKGKESPYQAFTKRRNVGLTVNPTLFPSIYCFSELYDEEKKLCDQKVLELEECLDEYQQAAMLNFGENTDEVTKSQIEYMSHALKLIALRNEFVRIQLAGQPLNDESKRRELFLSYKKSILVDAVRLYYRLGARGGASAESLLQDEVISGDIDVNFNRIAQATFEKCQIAILQTDLLREYTLHILQEAKVYCDRLSDERMGRLFKVNENIELPSINGDIKYAVTLTEEDYSSKQNIINSFVSELYKIGHQYVHDKTKEFNESKINVKLRGKAAANAKAPSQNLMNLIEDSKVFVCPRDDLTTVITKLAQSFTKWKESRQLEKDDLNNALVNRLLETIKNRERLVHFLAQERKELIENYKRDVRLAASKLAWDSVANTASLAVELHELRKARRAEERKLRNRIIDEYDDLVNELVMEIHVLRNRFHEYRINTVHQVMGIMSEAKKEELAIVVNNHEIPKTMRNRAVVAIDHEDQMDQLRTENHELKMTLLKVRSMYTIKEQALRNSYDKKIRKFTEDNKNAEEKLWDSYREAEARERALRKQLTIVQKAQVSADTENETLQRLLKEEQARSRQLAANQKSNDRAQSAGARHARSPASASGTRSTPPESKTPLQSVPDKSAPATSTSLMNELAEKTALLERFVRERQTVESFITEVAGTGRARMSTPQRPMTSLPSVKSPRAAPLVRPKTATRPWDKSTGGADDDNEFVVMVRKLVTDHKTMKRQLKQQETKLTASVAPPSVKKHDVSLTIAEVSDEEAQESLFVDPIEMANSTTATPRRSMFSPTPRVSMASNASSVSESYIHDDLPGNRWAPGATKPWLSNTVGPTPRFFGPSQRNSFVDRDPDTPESRPHSAKRLSRPSTASMGRASPSGIGSAKSGNASGTPTKLGFGVSMQIDALSIEGIQGHSPSKDSATKPPK